MDEEESKSTNKTGIIIDPRLPVQWREIEGDESEISNELNEYLGPLAVLLFNRIKQLKIIDRMNGLSL